MEQELFLLPSQMTSFQRYIINPIIKRLGVLQLQLAGADARNAARSGFNLPVLSRHQAWAVPHLPHGFMALVGTSMALEQVRPLAPGSLKSAVTISRSNQQ